MRLASGLWQPSAWQTFSRTGFRAGAGAGREGLPGRRAGWRWTLGALAVAQHGLVTGVAMGVATIRTESHAQSAGSQLGEAPA